ncbi:MAG: DUF1801 domain-containing protein [Anaerolineae bacterium]|nr:DUF1801 domain-containing protein [Anaerolineae bacterium]
MTTKKDKVNSTKNSAANAKKSQGFTDDELAAMKERAKEMKKGSKADGESDLLEKIAEMEEPDRGMAQRLHEIMKANAPTLAPKTWYGMPAYATEGKDGKIVCFFQPAKKFNARYATLGFNDPAHLDEGHMWATSFALTQLTPTEEAKIIALVKKAIS